MEFINIISTYILNNWIELVGAITGIFCVYLNTKEKILAFPIAIITCSFYVVVFYMSKFYADMWLQVIFILLSFHGWYQWLFGGAEKTELRISNTLLKEYATLVPAGMGLTIAGFYYYSNFTDAVSPFWDSFNTAFSLVAQFLLNRKRLQNWIFWIIVDIIYIPLFLWREKYPTAVLYVIFLSLAIKGYLDWKKSMQKQLLISEII